MEEALQARGAGEGVPNEKKQHIVNRVLVSFGRCTYWKGAGAGSLS